MRTVRVPVSALLVGLACAVAFEAHADVTSDLLGLTGGQRVQLVWSRPLDWGGWGNVSGGGAYRLIVFDTATGSERDLLGSVGNYFAAYITHDGNQVVYRNGGNIWAVNWDGSNNRQLVGGAGMGCTSAGGYVYAIMGGGVRRVEIANPSNQLQVYTGGVHEGGWNLNVSIDDAYLGCAWGPGQYGLVSTSDGSLNNFHNEGCWAAVSPDTQYRFCVFDYPHRNWRVWDFDHSNYRVVNLNSAPGINGWEVFYPRFAGNNARYVTVCGPFDQGGMGGNNIAVGSPNVEVHFGRFDGGLTRVEAWVKVTANGQADYYATSLVGASGTPPTPRVAIDSFTADPTVLSPGESTTLTWATSNATAVTIDGNPVAASGSGPASPPTGTTTYTLVAEGEGGPVTREVTVMVLDPGSVHLKLDCGTDSPAADWISGNSYVNGGQNYGSLPVPGNLGSLVNPAPEAVYVTCRHLTDHTYEVPVPNGEYLVRLHFNDTAETRGMTYRIEGAEKLSDYDPPNAAEIKEFGGIQVSDGYMSIEAQMTSGNDVFECGIEIIGGSAQPNVTIDSFTASPDTVVSGGSSTLSWATSNATAVTLDGNTVAASDSGPVTPASTTVYTLVAEGQGGPVSREVTVTVVQPGSVTVDSFTADPVSIAPGASSTLSWTTSNADSVSIDNGIGDVAADGSQAVSPAATTTYTITAQGQDGPASRQVTVTVSASPALPLKVNCGGGDPYVDGWEEDDPYISGGGDWLFSASPDTTGVAGAAPPEVYRTLRHAGGDTGFTFSVPPLAVPNGQYTVKLHFYDEYNEAARSMDVTIEGVKVLDDFNVAEEAGSGRALVKEFEVTVSDGDGLQIVGDRDTGNDVFWSAVEIHAGGTQTSDVTIDSFGATPGTIDQGASSTLVWSTSNATSVTLDGNAVTADGSFTVNPTETTTHTLVAEGPGGPVTQEATITVITVTPTITLLSPVGGEVWYVGTTPHIQWTTSNQDNVMILYSADGGATWEIVAGTILSTAPEWGDAPWTIPDTPSANCILHIRDYWDVQPSDVSGTFEIRAVTDSDSDDMDDDWEVEHFGDTTTADATTDYDGDGVSDLEEFLAGTDPLVGPGGGSGTGFSCAPWTGGRPGAALAACIAAALLALGVRRRPGCRARQGRAPER